MTGDDAIRFPSSDSFDIKMEGFVEWSIIPDKLPLLYVAVRRGRRAGPVSGGEGDPALRPQLLPAGRQPVHRPRFHQRRHEAEVPARVREQAARGVREAGDRGVCRRWCATSFRRTRSRTRSTSARSPSSRFKTLEQQIQVAKSQADLATQTEMADAEPEDRRGEQAGRHDHQEGRAGAATSRSPRRKQDLAVAKLRLEAAKKQADAHGRPRAGRGERHPAEQAGRGRAAAAAGRRLRRRRTRTPSTSSIRRSRRR